MECLLYSLAHVLTPPIKIVNYIKGTPKLKEKMKMRETLHIPWTTIPGIDRQEI